MAFRFHALPPELKRFIWDLALPEIQSEVSIVWPPRQTPTPTTTAADLSPVDAQAAAGGAFPVRFRASRHAFVPALDMLYLCSCDFERAVLPRLRLWRREGEGASGRSEGEGADDDGGGIWGHRRRVH